MWKKIAVSLAVTTFLVGSSLAQAPNSASRLAPGQQAKTTGKAAKTLAPGQKAKSTGKAAKTFAPGQAKSR